MIDLELVDALLDALPEAAPLVLVGDAHQLPAIDVGQILADLAEPDGAAALRVAVLTQSYRMDTGDVHGRAVYEAAAAVHAGAVQKLAERGGLATPRTPGTLTVRGVEWVDDRRRARPARPQRRPRPPRTPRRSPRRPRWPQRMPQLRRRTRRRPPRRPRPLRRPRRLRWPRSPRAAAVEAADASADVDASATRPPATAPPQTPPTPPSPTPPSPRPPSPMPAPRVPAAWRAPAKAEHEITLAVAEALWHHFEGPRRAAHRQPRVPVRGRRDRSRARARARGAVAPARPRAS